MSPAAIITVTLATHLAAIPLVLLVARGLIRSHLHRLFAACPPHTPLPGAIHRRFQSFSIGIVNLGGSIHVSADSDHLHLNPAMLVRWFGMKPVSIQWEAIAVDPVKRSFTNAATIRIDGASWTMRAPRWCLELARPSSP